MKPQNKTNIITIDLDVDPPIGISARKYCLKRLESFYKQYPNHEMFHQKVYDKLSMPYDDWVKKFTTSVFNDKEHFMGNNECWLGTSQIQITVQGNKSNGEYGTIVYKRLKTVRLLAFLATPTQKNWDALIVDPLYSPFDHHCANGEIVGRTKECINGFEHGTFSTRNENESRKQCTNGCLALCPGHGPCLSKCIFVHKDTGKLKPCKMNPTMLPVCHCERKCY